MGVPVIDLFAGPGGLGEGFSSIYENGERVFDIKLSIEKDEHAHETLRLRSFYRQFPKNDIPELYYDYIKENDPKQQSLILEKLKSENSEQWEESEKEAWCFELPYPIEIRQRTKYKNGVAYKESYTIGYTEEDIETIHDEVDNRIEAVLPANNEFLLIGGPPCQAYSLVGRARNQGISDTDHRVHLYKEYLRIIAKHHPAVFVMENVKGLLSAKVGDTMMFDLIKNDLTNPGTVFPDLNAPRYRIYSFVKEPDSFDDNNFPVYKDNKDFLIKSEKYSVPQRRHRVILLGVREDIVSNQYSTLKELKKEITLKEVIGELPTIRSGIGRKVVGKNVKGNHVYQSINNVYANWVEAVEEYLLKLDAPLKNVFPNFPNIDNQGMNFLPEKEVEHKNSLYNKWYEDKRLNGVLNHESRTHLKEDLGRYLFSALYLRAKGEFPRLLDYPRWLLPKHKNAKAGDKFADRFRTQKPDQAATTVTSHISKDGHYFIHYDPSQCRSLTVREAARIQTFPDNYYFCGSRTHQYHQVGNAVPPYLAKQMGEIVKELFKYYEKSTRKSK